jgi:hypothetical protein
MGVAYWILPRLRTEGRSSRGRTWLAWCAFGLLNGGILAVAGGTLAAGAPGAPGAAPGSALAAAVVPLGKLAEFAAAVCFAAHAWPRVRAAGTPTAKPR